MQITCYRALEFAREPRFLPAATYNLAHALLSRCTSGCLFVPIRAMQYLAILDAEEFVFLDGERKCWIDISWHSFRPQSRNSLEDPVSYDAVYYTLEANQIMSRLQREFFLALQQLAGKEPACGMAKVIKFTGQKKIPADK